MHSVIQKAVELLKETFKQDLKELGLFRDIESPNNPFRRAVEDVIEENILAESSTSKLEEALNTIKKHGIPCSRKNCGSCLELKGLSERAKEEIEDAIDPYCNILVNHLKYFFRWSKRNIYMPQDPRCIQPPALTAEKPQPRFGRGEAEEHPDTSLPKISERFPAVDAVHARSLIAEAVLNRNREVEDFRKRYLNGRLLSGIEEAYEFLKQRERSLEGDREEGFEILRAAKPGEEWTEALAVENPLGRDLKKLAKMLEPLWREHQAVLFVLTGTAGGPVRYADIGLSLRGPESPEIVGRLQSEFITLKLSPILPSSYAERAFKAAKAAFKEMYQPEKYGAVPKQERLLWLAVFVAEELSKKKVSWRQLMSEWNASFLKELSERFPERKEEIMRWKFSSERNFANKARKALCGLLAASWEEVRNILSSN